MLIANLPRPNRAFIYWLVSTSLLLASLVCSTPVQAENIEILTLKHRSADELLPLLEPLLKQDEAITGINQQLIIRANPPQQRQIKQLLQQLDTPRHNLLISVIQDLDQQSAQQLLNGQAELQIDQQGIRLQGDVRISSNRELKSRQQQQQIRVLEGALGLIQTKQQQAYPQREIIRDHRGSRIIERQYLQQANNGFYVRAHIKQQQVKLEILAQDDQFQDSPSRLQQHQIHSSLSGSIGQWLVLADQQQQEQQQQQGLISLGNSQLSQQRITLIKVEFAD